MSLSRHSAQWLVQNCVALSSLPLLFHWKCAFRPVASRHLSRGLGGSWRCRLALKHAFIFMCICEHKIATFGKLSIAKTVLPLEQEHSFLKSALFEKVTKSDRQLLICGTPGTCNFEKNSTLGPKVSYLIQRWWARWLQMHQMCSRGTKVNGKWHPKGQQAPQMSQKWPQKCLTRAICNKNTYDSGGNNRN